MPSSSMPRGTNFRQSAGDEKNRLKERYQITLPPADLMQNIAVPKDFDRSFELQQGIPIDGSKQSLRAYSPFTIEVVPPLIFSNNPKLEDNQKSRRDVNIVSAGWSQKNAFEIARDKINNRNLSTQKFTNSASRTKLEEFATKAGKQFRRSNTDQSQHNTQNSSDAPIISDVKMAANIAIQLTRILKAPPLTLLINPQSFQVQYGKIQQFSERVRNGFIFQAWGEEQPKISFSGRIGAFYAGASEIVEGTVTGNGKNPNPSRTPTGVQFASKRNSASWQNLMNMFQLYMSNGYIVDQVTRSNAHLFVGALAIKYDQWVYVGNMNSFSFGYEETNQNGGLQFDVEFTVVAMYDLAQPITAVQPLRAPTQSPSARRNRPNITGNSPASQENVLFGRGSGQNLGVQGESTFFNRDTGTPPPGSTNNVSRGSNGFRTPAPPPAANPLAGVPRRPDIFAGLGRSSL